MDNRFFPAHGLSMKSGWDFLGEAAPLLALAEGDRWRPGIGDPSPIGWLTVAAYFAAAFLCWRASVRGLSGPKVRLFWTATCGMLLLLGVNKQLDLQTAFTFFGRDLARAGGWYENRRAFQAVFVVLIALGGVAASGFLLWAFRSEWRRLWPALAGVALLLAFIVVRAASFHHVDQLLAGGPAGVRLNWLFELGGIAAIAWPAWRAVRKSSDTSFVWVSGGGARGPAPAPRVHRALRPRH